MSAIEPEVGQRWRRLTSFPGSTGGVGHGEVVELDVVLEKRVEGVVVRSADKIIALRRFTGVTHKGQRRRILRRTMARHWELVR